MKSLYKDNENLKNQSNLNLFANNIIGLQPIIKWLKLFQCLKNKIGPKGIIFFQDTQSSVGTEKKWFDQF